MTGTLFIDPKYKIHQLARTGYISDRDGHVYFNENPVAHLTTYKPSPAEDGHEWQVLVTGNSFAIAVIPVTAQDIDTEVTVPTAAIDKAQKLQNKRKFASIENHDGRWHVPTRNGPLEYQAQDVFNYADRWERVVPVTGRDYPVAPILHWTLNAPLLEATYMALGNRDKLVFMPFRPHNPSGDYYTVPMAVLVYPWQNRTLSYGWRPNPPFVVLAAIENPYTLE